MRHRIILLAFLSACSLCAQSAFYVNGGTGNDSGDGSQGRPWRTISRAAQVLANTPYGAIVHVAPGDYAGALTLRNGGSGRLTFLSDVHWGAHVFSVGVDRVVSINGDSITFQGFEVTGDLISRLGIIINGSYDYVIDNHVHALPTAICTSNGGAGIDSASATGHDNDIVRNLVHDIGFGLPCDLVHGIYYANRGGHCSNNIVYRVPGAGINTWHGANSVIISNNLVFAAAEDGILIGNGDSGSGSADHFVVTNNIVINNGHYGITEFGKAVGRSNVYASNNVYGNSAGDYHIISGVTPTGTVSADPRLVNYQPDGSGDYHLGTASPSVDRGTNTGAPVTDLDGVARPANMMFDIGPYER
jgi:Right handed beta helix region/Protein of unknown function (DUF1565)